MVVGVLLLAGTPTGGGASIVCGVAPWAFCGVMGSSMWTGIGGILAAKVKDVMDSRVVLRIEAAFRGGERISASKTCKVFFHMSTRLPLHTCAVCGLSRVSRMT